MAYIKNVGKSNKQGIANVFPVLEWIIFHSSVF